MRNDEEMEKKPFLLKKKLNAVLFYTLTKKFFN